MDSKEMTQSYRLKQWSEIIHERQSSGQTIRQWCVENSINENAYYYWLRRVREAVCESVTTSDPGINQIVPVKLPAQINDDLKSKNPEPSSAIIVHFGSVTLELNNGASSTLIEDTLRALQNVR